MALCSNGNAPITHDQQTAVLDIHIGVDVSDKDSKSPTRFEISHTTSNSSRGRKSLHAKPRKEIDRRRSTMILGHDTYTDEWLEWRVKWAQRGIGIFSFVTSTCYIVSNLTGNSQIYFVFSIMSMFTLLCTWLLYYQNFSFAILKRLMKEPAVAIILVLTTLNFFILILVPDGAYSWVSGLMYMLLINAFVFMDAIVVKSRYLIIGVGVGLVVLSIFNVYGNLLAPWHEGKILLEYSIDTQNYKIMKRDTLRAIYLQILFFNLNAVYTMCYDRKMELMLFGTDNVYRRSIADAEVSAKAPERRVRWAQAFTIAFGFVGVIIYILSKINGSRSLRFIIAILGTLSLIPIFVLFYSNTSSLLLKRILKEPNALLAIASVILNFIFRSIHPIDEFSPFFGFIYMLITCVFVFTDGLIYKSRYFVIAFGFGFFAISIFNLYGNTFGNWNVGVVFAQYTIDGQSYTIMERSTQRTIYLQTLLVCVNALYTMLADRSSKKMLFVYDNIYRHNGTTRRSIHDNSFAIRVNKESSGSQKKR